MKLLSIAMKVLGFICVCAVIWFAGPLFAFAGFKPLGAPATRLILIAVIIFAWLGKKIYRRIQTAIANKQLTKEIVAKPLQEASAADADIATLSHNLSEALTTLKNKAGAGLYELPWYIIIGAPGTGKTTALANSGLRFPMAEHTDSAAVQGVGGTRNCDWWFAEEAIFLDTAGRYTTQDSDAEADNTAWLSFLKMLRKGRSRRPINGVVLTVSTSSLLESSPGVRDRLLHALRQRLQELQSHLGVNPPVYLLVTKTDLLQGFQEFFEDLGQRERQQVLGFTFDLAQNESLSTIPEKFRSLLSSINNRVLWRMRSERDRRHNNSIFAFPQQLATLSEPLTEFCQSLFSASRYEATPLLRGIYFTSGTQEGTPIDRLVGSYARSLSVQESVGRGQARSFFVHDVVRSVMLSERELVGSNKKLEQRNRWIQRGVIAGAAASLVLGLILWGTSYARNNSLVAEYEQKIADFQTLQAAKSGPEGLDGLLERLDAAASPLRFVQEKNSDTPLTLRFGLYQGHVLAEEAETLYQAELEQFLLPTMTYLIGQNLSRPGTDPQLIYEALKVYLMLSQPERREPQLIRTWMGHEWEQLLPGKPRMRGRLQEHVNAITAEDFKAVTADTTLVQTARTTLSQSSMSALLYARIKQDYEFKGQPPVMLLDAAGPYGKEVFSVAAESPDPSVSQLFTRDGYKDSFQPQLQALGQLAADENWVMENAAKKLTEEEIKELQEEIQALYFTEYIQTWDSVLDRMRISPFKDLSTATRRLKFLSGESSPFVVLAQRVFEETSLATGAKVLDTGVASGSVIAGAADRLGKMLGAQQQDKLVDQIMGPERTVDKHYEGLHQFFKANDASSTPAKDTQALINDVYKEFDLLSSGLLNDADTRLSGLFDSDQILQLQLQARDTAPPLNRWLTEIANNSRGAVFGELRLGINKAWASDVAGFCSQAASGRYPFSAQSSREITLSDFAKLFGPNGLIASFQKDHLDSFIANKGRRWSWQNFPGIDTTFSTAALTQLRRADRIRRAFFAGGAPDPSISFGLSPVYLDANVRRVSLEIDQEAFQYRHGPARVFPVKWPAQTGVESAVRFEFKDDSAEAIAQTIRGQWSLFRFLDQTQRTSVSSENINFTLEYKGRKTIWQIKSQGIENPFAKDVFANFSCIKSF